jgi:hypothetical protein
MYKINQRSTQLPLGIGFIALFALQLFIDLPPSLDFVAGAGFGIGAGLLVAAIAGLKIIPEKKTTE